ncbi:MAG: DNA polymerase III subunit gamma/tau, partial [Spirochaetota bacterium]
MPYEITATRKRPQGFEELAGQDFVSATLEASLASGRIAHAYLFSGPRGCGKTSTARILAKALNCEKGPGAKPCGVCSNCVSITAGSSLDVIEIDGASNTSVDNVRQIKDEVLFPPNSGRYKVYIIDEVHMLSMSAFNALLKTIEEPPPYVIFIFATTEMHKVPATIKSRCQQFTFRLIPVETINTLLAVAAKDMTVEADDESLLWIAKESGGSLRDAYTLFDQVVAFSDGRLSGAKIREKLGLIGLDAMNGLFESLVVQEADGSGSRGLEALDAFLARGISAEQFVVDVIDYLRSLLLLKNGIGREALIGAPAAAYSRTVLDALDSEKIERGLALFFDLHRNLRTSPNQRFELELAVTRLSRLHDQVSPTALALAVTELRRGLVQGLPGQVRVPAA